jgi:hypothetical protein
MLIVLTLIGLNHLIIEVVDVDVGMDVDMDVIMVENLAKNRTKILNFIMYLRNYLVDIGTE